MPLERTAFAAVRKCLDENREFFLVCEIDLLERSVQVKTRENDKDIPHYGIDNPVQRIIKVKIIEVE